jgi:hypothetical protein
MKGDFVEALIPSWMTLKDWIYVKYNKLPNDNNPSFIFISLGLCTIQEWNVLHMITIFI